MKLFELLRPFLNEMPALKDRVVHGLQNDSRLISSGDLFIAYPGAVTDGRKYIQAAINAGAVAILFDPKETAIVADYTSDTPLIPLPFLETKLALIGCHFYNNPSEKLLITGVTGTNGKTTIAYQLAQAYGLLGRRAAYIGTIGQGDVQNLEPLLNTTPDALCLQKLLHDYETQGVQDVCMEVSSHALSLGRVDGIEFNQAIYTNLTQDHLDFHGSMDAYAMAKASLFSKSTLQNAIINQDDAHYSLMRAQIPATCRVLSYGLGEGADIVATQWETGMSGSTMEVVSPWGKHTLHIQSLGRFNLYNSLAVFASLLASEAFNASEVVEVMSELKPSPGRMEIVNANPCVIVDYAHTPDALENVLLMLSALKQAKLWVVFGCGGNRDKSKRPIMGRIASQYADIVVLTNDNPRREDPEVIAEEVLQGMPNGVEPAIILDRRAAIEHALSHASKQDIVLIAGKGHEDYQIIGDKKYPFSDQAVVHEFFSL
jgi:UDP-N-acetylmuramoyl-L-alanyl-D-glutamate--2,6-diaminopimelate ligase